MKRKNQNKCYRARVAILIIVFVNIYQIFRSVTLLKHMLIINQYVASNYCLINSVINMYFDDTPSVDFCTTRIQGITTLKDTMRRTVTFLFYQMWGEVLFEKINLLIQGNIYKSEKRNNKIL